MPPKTTSTPQTEKKNTTSNSSNLENDQDLFKERTDLESNRFQALNSLLNRFSARTKKYNPIPKTNNLNSDQDLFKVRTDLERNIFQHLYSSLERFSISFIKNIKHESPKIIKRIITATKKFTQQISEYANNHSLTIKYKTKTFISNSYLISKIFISKARIIPTSIIWFSGLTFITLAKLSQKAAIKLKGKVELVKNTTFAVKSIPSWNINSAIMVLIISFIFLVVYRIQPSGKQIKDADEHLLANINSSLTITENSASTEQNEPVAIKEIKAKFNIELPSVLGSTVDDVSAKKEVAIIDEANRTNPHVRTNSPSKESELNILLALASRQFDAKKLTTPTGDNAYETYQFILFTNPKHVGALEGVKMIHNKYITWANHYLKNNERTRAKNSFNKALAIEPNNQTTIRALEVLKIHENRLSRKNLLLLTKQEPSEAQTFLDKANEKMLKIEEGIVANQRDYKMFQDAHQTYQKILEKYPNSTAAKLGLVMIKNFYHDWAELEAKNKTLNTSAFLYKQAQSIQFNETDIKQHIEKLQIVIYEENIY